MALSEAMVEAAIRGVVSAAIREGTKPVAAATAVARIVLAAAGRQAAVGTSARGDVDVVVEKDIENAMEEKLHVSPSFQADVEDQSLCTDSVDKKLDTDIEELVVHAEIAV